MGDSYSNARFCLRGVPAASPLDLVREGVMEELRAFSRSPPGPHALFETDVSGKQIVTVRVSVRTVADDPDELPEFGPTFHVTGGYRMISGKSHDRSVALNYVKGATLAALGLREHVPDVIRFIVEDL